MKTISYYPTDIPPTGFNDYENDDCPYNKTVRDAVDEYQWLFLHSGFSEPDARNEVTQLLSPENRTGFYEFIEAETSTERTTKKEQYNG